MFNVQVNIFSVMLGRSHHFLGITSTFCLGGGGKYVLLKDTTRRPEWGSNPRPLDPESEVLTTRPPRPRLLLAGTFYKSKFGKYDEDILSRLRPPIPVSITSAR